MAPILFIVVFLLGGILLLIYAPRVREFFCRSYQQGLEKCGLTGSVWDRYPGAWIFRLFGAAMIVFVVIAASGGFRRRDCSWISQLNPDVYCRITDSRESKELVEYFDIDTNDLKLYLRQNGRDQLIEHPHDKISNFRGKIDENTIRFNPADENILLVNGEVFPLDPVRKQ